LFFFIFLVGNNDIHPIGAKIVGAGRANLQWDQLFGVHHMLVV
jgi:hypothetical protein